MPSDQPKVTWLHLLEDGQATHAVPSCPRWLQTDEAAAVDTEAQMKAAAAEEAGGSGQPAGGGSQAEELVPAEVNADLLKQMEEMVGGACGARGGLPCSCAMDVGCSPTFAARAPPARTSIAAQGFPAARATRALYHSGGENLEAAVGWLEEHQGDADLDEPLLVPKVGGMGAPWGGAQARPPPVVAPDVIRLPMLAATGLHV